MNYSPYSRSLGCQPYTRRGHAWNTMNHNLILIPMMYYIYAHARKPRTWLYQPFIDANAFVLDMRAEYVRYERMTFRYHTSQNHRGMVCSEHKTRPFVVLLRRVVWQCFVHCTCMFIEREQWETKDSNHLCPSRDNHQITMAGNMIKTIRQWPLSHRQRHFLLHSNQFVYMASIRPHAFRSLSRIWARR